ncbi:MAG: anti-sigma factor family protein [Actinomycetota bacterium]
MTGGRFRHLGDEISAYLDGELSDVELRKAASHLAGCDVCRDEMEETMMVRARLRSLPLLEPPALLGLATDHVRPFRRRRAMIAGAAAAAMAAILAASSFMNPEKVVALSSEDLVSSFRARASLDPNFTGRMVPLEQIYGIQLEDTQR